MDGLERARVGFETVEASPAARVDALRFLQRWLTDTTFADYRPQLDSLIQNERWAGLLDRFYQILPFGTGGRRGAVGIGPNRFNLWSLTASVQGHCEYLRERFPAIHPLRVVLAYDVRQFEDVGQQYSPSLANPTLHLSSKQFARQAACVYAANGIHAHILPESSTRFLATPELSYAIRKLGAHGGLNISASHNPSDDNGGKFYDERGGQPIPPEDQIMADLVEQVAEIKQLPWNDAVRMGKIHFLDSTTHRAYIELCLKQSLIPAPRVDEVQIVFTPLHGVGSQTALEVLEAQGFRVRTVEEQMSPDGRFPHVTGTPNPELPAALDRAQLLGDEIQADLVLATDPDADRLGGMARDAEGKLRYLDGNTIAALLTYFKLSRLAEAGHLPAKPIVIKTLITTELVTRIARHFQAQIVDDLLVGFKYIGDVLWQLEQQGCYGEVEGSPADFIIGCEESHGILLTSEIRDKDAGASALLLAELALDQKRRGSDIPAYLDRIHRKLGYFRTTIRSLVLPGIEGKANMARILQTLRESPPHAIADLPITSFEDMRDETGRLGPFKGGTDRAARNFLHFRLGDSARVAFRPSGTEPKAKAYIEVCSPPIRSHQSEADWLRQCREVDNRLVHLADAFLATCRQILG